MRRIALAAAICGLLGTGNLATAGLITNGGFEAPVISSGTYSIFGSIPGWTTSFGPGIEIQNNIAGTPYEGSQLVELDSDANSGMYQDIATVAGKTYKLSFAYSPRAGVGADSNGIDLWWDGGFVANITASGIGNPDTVWSLHSYDLVASSALTRIEFGATGISESLGGYLDAVSVCPTAVPEPSSLVLSGVGGVFGLGYLRSRRRAKNNSSV